MSVPSSGLGELPSHGTQPAGGCMATVITFLPHFSPQSPSIFTRDQSHSRFTICPHIPVLTAARVTHNSTLSKAASTENNATYGEYHPVFPVPPSFHPNYDKHVALCTHSYLGQRSSPPLPNVLCYINLLWRGALCLFCIARARVMCSYLLPVDSPLCEHSRRSVTVTVKRKSC